MQFKDGEIRDQYHSQKLNRRLNELLGILERTAILAGHEEGITLTEIYRVLHPKTGDLDKGYHPLWQAVDVRTRDWSKFLRTNMEIILRAIFALDNRMQYVFESDHLHLEFDDGTAAKKREA